MSSISSQKVIGESLNWPGVSRKISQAAEAAFFILYEIQNDYGNS